MKYRALKEIPAEKLFYLWVEGRLLERESGPIAYERREPSCTEALLDAFKFATSWNSNEIQATFIRTIQAILTKNSNNHAYKPGEIFEPGFFTFISSEHRYNLFSRHVTIDGLVEYFNVISKEGHDIVGKLNLDESFKETLPIYNKTISSETLSELMQDLGISDFRELAEKIINSLKSKPTARIQYTPNLDSNNLQRLEKICNRYNQEIKDANTKDQKLLAITHFVKAGEMIHPFSDYNGRTFANICLNLLLLQNGFSPCIMYEYNILDFHSTSEIIQEIKYGMDNYSNLIEGRKIYSNFSDEEKKQQCDQYTKSL